jgi:catalase
LSFIYKHYFSYHRRRSEGADYLSQAEADRMLSIDSDHATRDLFDSIAKGNYPSWKLCLQVMSEEEAANFRYDILDVTKVGDYENGTAKFLSVIRM